MTEKETELLNALTLKYGPEYVLAALAACYLTRAQESGHPKDARKYLLTASGLSHTASRCLLA